MVIWNVFISSKYRLNPNEKPNIFGVFIPPDFISCNDKKTIKVNIINFHTPNTMYNVNDNNNNIELFCK